MVVKVVKVVILSSLAVACTVDRVSSAVTLGHVSCQLSVLTALVL